MSKDTFYFSHDYNARADDKIKGLIRKHGMSGYGAFWAIVEDLYNNANALQKDYEGIAYDLRVDSEVVKSIINDFDLFCFENGSFGSSSIEKRLDERNSKSEKARESAFKRWNRIKADANAMQSHSESNAIKESKVKESKEYIYSCFYDSELEKNNDALYLSFVKFLFGENDLGRPLSKLLKMDDQIGYKHYLKLKQLSEEYSTKIYDKCKALENDKKGKYSSFYLTINNWMKHNFQK